MINRLYFRRSVGPVESALDLLAEGRGLVRASLSNLHFANKKNTLDKLFYFSSFLPCYLQISSSFSNQRNKLA